ncbi:hypothetical protein Celaphus_00012005 [Cervus elaphus hippelaphus]|uniref:Uncharacterized protein n=1 Tax=Cervus elaphus hippelaphus TaxID=46360 RepID=A0A212CL94_CEREH|nr:hypothetical protein Celaphus_00012005 [Cervus elaphus hippelaphus]
MSVQHSGPQLPALQTRLLWLSRRSDLHESVVPAPSDNGPCPERGSRDGCMHMRLSVALRQELTGGRNHKACQFLTHDHSHSLQASVRVDQAMMGNAALSRVTATGKVPRSLSVTRTQARVDARRALAALDVIAVPGVMPGNSPLVFHVTCALINGTTLCLPSPQWCKG